MDELIGDERGASMAPGSIGYLASTACRAALTTGLIIAAAGAGVQAQHASPVLAGAPEKSVVSDDMGASDRPGAAMLDGRSFRVRIVGDSEERTAADRLTFDAGRFSSELCRKYNFADAPYWVRREGRKVLFRVETVSPTDGRMVWTGEIEGDEFRGEMAWTKPRWYRTIRAQHRITGTAER
jgi:hypothetical protein